MPDSQNAKELLKKTRERRHAQVTLSTGDVFEMWFRPLSEAEDERIREAIKDDKRSGAYGYQVLVSLAEYENGEKMFTKFDIPSLRNDYSKFDLGNIMESLIVCGGVLASQDPKSHQGGDQGLPSDEAPAGDLQGAGDDSITAKKRSVG